MPTTDLENDLRKDPRTQARLNHLRDAAAAEAAVRFFCYGEPSPEVKWYGSETWRQIMEVFATLAPIAEPTWYDATNNDPGSLRTGKLVPLVGQVVEIEGEGKKRYVTSTMGSPGRYHAHFKFQGVVALDRVRWRIVASSPYLESADGNGPSPPKPTPHVTTGRLLDGNQPSPVSPPPPGGREPHRSLATRIREHPVVSIIVLLAVGVIGLGSLTDALDKIIAFVRSHYSGPRKLDRHLSYP